jgi:hypothetical protein
MSSLQCLVCCETGRDGELPVDTVPLIPFWSEMSDIGNS